MTVAQVGESTRSSFGEGFEAYAAGDMARLTRLASMLTRNPESARDLVQDTLVRVGCAWSRIDRDGNPAGYATTTMSRLAWRQAARSQQELSLLRRNSVSETAPDDFKRVDDAAALRVAMHALGDRQRAVLVLRLLQRHVRGTDRQHARVLRRHREEPDRPRTGQSAGTPAAGCGPVRRRGGLT